MIYSPLHNSRFLIEEIKNQNKDYVMASGNLINIDNALKIEGFNNHLFIDEVDHEFCIRTRIEGYKILQNQQISVNHELGEKKYFCTLYPPIRLYYMIRNYLYIRKKYLNLEKGFLKKRDSYLFKFFIKNLIFSSAKYHCIKMLFLGILDFKYSKMGKFVDEL